MPKKTAKKPKREKLEKLKEEVLKKENVEKVFSSIDGFFKTLREYIEVRYRIERKTVKLQKQADMALERARKDLRHELISFKRGFVWTVVESALVVTAVFSVFLGIALMLSRLMPAGYVLPLVLLLYGVVVGFAVLLKIQEE